MEREKERLEAFLSGVSREGSTSWDPRYIVHTKCGSSDCKGETNLTYPYCLECTKTTLRLTVKASSLKDAGFGLFAWSPGEAGPVFRAGERIGEYRGRKVTVREARQLEDSAKCYLIEAQTNSVSYHDGSMTTTGVCRYINDPNDSALCNADFNYVVPPPYAAPSSKLKNDKVRCVLIVAIRDIAHNEEIYMSYGNERWMAHCAKGPP